MGGRGKKFKERKRKLERLPKPAKTPKRPRSRKGRQTKKQVLFFSDKAQQAIDKALADNKNVAKTISFEALTGKRARATTSQVRGTVGGERVAKNVKFSQISVQQSAKNIPLTGKGNLLNVHKWHKGTEYDEKNTRPFRVQLLKNGKFMLRASDTTRFAHYIATGGNLDSIRVVYTRERMTSKKIAGLQQRFREGKITKARMSEALDIYNDQMTGRLMRRELGGNRTSVPTRYGGTTGNATGGVRRSEPAPRSKRTGIYNAEATTGTRTYKTGRKSRKSEATKQREKTYTILPATESGRLALRRSRAARNRKPRQQ